MEVIRWNVNLASESFVRHLGTPTPFINNRNNNTYYITWNTFWAHNYENIMAPAHKVIEKAKEKYPVFENLAKLIKVISATNLTAYYGPIIYSDYGSSESIIKYDTEKALYEKLFKDLDDIAKVFGENLDNTDLKEFDASYEGSMDKWAKLVNSLRLRLAMRLAKKDPAKAKEEAEKALAHTAGLIQDNENNFYISLYGNEMPESIICFSWNDTRMSATMESVLVGYKDPRIKKFFEPATLANATYPDSAYPYKGIATSAILSKKDLRIPYSTISSSFKSVTKRIVLSAAEVLFLKAEAALRGWALSGNAQVNYERRYKSLFWSVESIRSRCLYQR